MRVFVASAVIAGAGMACGGSETSGPSAPAAEDEEARAPAHGAEGATTPDREEAPPAPASSAAAGAPGGDEVVATVGAAIGSEEPEAVLEDIVMPEALLEEALAGAARTIPEEGLHRELEAAGLEAGEDGAIDTWAGVIAREIREDLFDLGRVRTFLRSCDGTASWSDLDVIERAHVDLAEGDEYDAALGQHFAEAEDIALWARGCPNTLDLFVARYRGGDAFYLLDLHRGYIAPGRLQELEGEHGKTEAADAPAAEGGAPEAERAGNERCHAAFDNVLDLMAEEFEGAALDGMEEEREELVRECGEALAADPEEMEESLECMIEATSIDDLAQCEGA